MHMGSYACLPQIRIAIHMLHCLSPQIVIVSATHLSHTICMANRAKSLHMAEEVTTTNLHCIQCVHHKQIEGLLSPCTGSIHQDCVKISAIQVS